ncbi:MAG: hypothetical protein WB755_28190 [Terriglobales bacterium]
MKTKLSFYLGKAFKRLAKESSLSTAIIALALLLCAPVAKASEVSITFTQDGEVMAGGSVDFSITITNITSSTIFLTGSRGSATSPLSIDTTNFGLYLQDNFPVSLGPGQSLKNIGAFTIAVVPSALPGLYGGSFGVLGGTNESAGDLLGSANFQTDVSVGVAPQTLQWSPGQKYDDGVDTNVAVHPSGLVLEIHQSHAVGNFGLWYHVGMLEGASVTWGGSQSLGSTEGHWPNFAISKEGYVILVRSSGQFKSGSQLRYQVGKIDPYGGINQSITWLHYGDWDAGFHSSIAINDNGVIVGVHETGHRGTGLYYRVGHLTNTAAGDYSITWDSGVHGIHYDDGINPHIGLNNRNEVVEVHQVSGENLLHYRRGTVIGGTINFAGSHRYDDNADRPAVALLDSGLVVELHGGVYARTGMLSPSNPAGIEWSDSVKISDHNGTNPAVATNGTYVIGTWEYFFDITGQLFYSVARIP